MFGRTGAGKSTLINAVFSGDVAPEGVGRPVTDRPTYYEHPSGCMGIWDSPGCETGHEGSRILGEFKRIIDDSLREPSEAIHVIWYCVRARDLRLEDKQADFIRELASLGIPVICVFTQVDRNADGQPFSDIRKFVVDVERRGLPLRPRNRVYLTMAKPIPERDQEAHGLSELLEATYRVAPDGVARALTAVQKIDIARKAASARHVVQAAAATAAATVLTPIPFADAALLPPIKIGMLGGISAVFGLDLERTVLVRLAGSAIAATGVIVGRRYIFGELAKLVPGFGEGAAMLINGTLAAPLTIAIGEAWIAVCKVLATMDADQIAAMQAGEIGDLFTTELKQRRDDRGK